MKDKFIFEESDDPLLFCDQYTLKADNNVTIQVRGSKICVTKWVKEEGSYHIGSFKTLEEAMTVALNLEKQVGMIEEIKTKEKKRLIELRSKYNDHP